MKFASGHGNPGEHGPLDPVREEIPLPSAEDPRWYRELVESAPDATVLIDANGHIQLVNAQAERLFGYPREELLGHSVEVLVPERSRGGHVVHRDAYFAEPKVREMGAGIALWGRRRDGSEFPVEISLSPIRVENRVLAVAAIRDATARKAASDQFRALLESAPDAMIIIDRTGHIRLVNAQVENLFSYRRAALIGKPIEVLLPERFRGQHVGHREGYFHTPKVRGMGMNLDLWGRRKDGSEFPIEISLSPLQSEEGQWAIAAVRDITERKAVERELGEYASNLSRSNQELEQFAYAASHDLRAPLRSIAGFAQLLQRRYSGRLDTNADEYIQFIVNSARQMQSLIDDLLAYSGVGRPLGEPEGADMEAVFAQVLLQLDSLLKERKAEVTHDPLPTVRIVDTQVNQLLQNLISNGIKFQPGPNPRVHVSATREGKYWHVAVRDQGIGIAPEHQDRVFKLFQRLHTSEEYEGTGIGLALCEKIVRLNGGRIWVESRLGEGSTFHFTLKAA
ncbi:MAG TPA: PAS domain S-box protein [Nevskiaceae bacterium]|nr:PAS domain S-box protein [Nevskiaceae bacterium]